MSQPAATSLAQSHAQGKCPPSQGAIPFAFFVSLVHAFAAAKPRKPRQSAKNLTESPSYAVQTFRNWVSELHRRYAPLSPGTTAVVFRLLFPDYDTDRKYAMQETRLAQYLAEIFAVSTTAQGRGNLLRNWDSAKTVGCLGIELQKVLEVASITRENALSIHDVDNMLTELASTCAFSAPQVRATSKKTEGNAIHRSKVAILRALFRVLSPAEACVTTQIILKDLQPLLYPLPEGDTHPTTLLLQYKSNAFIHLTPYDAMEVWDPSRRMLSAYRLRAHLDEAALVYEQMFSAEENPIPLKPQVGVAVKIPKCVKGQGCAQSLQLLGGSKVVWAETKYDGERAQIHVELTGNEPQITIFSKSGRNSTLDRVAVHSVIRDALRPGAETCKVKSNVILEAEMVAFSDTLDRIDEFWRIRSLVASTAMGPRHARAPRQPEDQNVDENSESQYSLISNASDGGTRHLALVFFDILMLNDEPLVSSAYSLRRATLESVIHCVPGRAMLAERTAISVLPTSECSEPADAQLRTVFSRLIADHQEGIVLKADEGKYNDGRLRWIKLKRDYIPGYGDALDLVIIGAAWEKNRARELRVAPTVFTTFYLGALSNKEAIRNNPRCLPHFEIFSTASFGLTREALEELNFLIRTSDPIKYTPSNPSNDLSYTYSLFQGLHAPAVVFRQPLLAEVYGAGFTKALQGQFYELRFPRLSKIHRPSERSWADSVTLQEFQEIARHAVGRDRPNKDVEDWCNTIWGKPSSPSAKCSVKRKRTEDVWFEKLEVVDKKEKEKEKEKEKRKRKVNPSSRASMRSAQVNRERSDEENEISGIEDASLSPKRLRTFGSVTNLPQSATVSVHQGSGSRQPFPESSSISNVGSADISFSGTPTTQTSSRTLTCSKPLGSCVIAQSREPNHTEHMLHSSRPSESSHFHSPKIGSPTRHMLSRERTEATFSNQTHEEVILDAAKYASTPLGLFLRNAIVWIARLQNAPRPTWRAPSQTVVPAAQQVHGLESFLQACKWCTPDQSSPSCHWVERGVVFVDDRTPVAEGKFWMDYPLKTLMERRSSLVDLPGCADCKPVWVFSIKLLSHEELQKPWNDIERRAICRLG